MDEVLRTARSCRHYAMCKIDFLGSGICASGPARHYVLFYPEGRMDLYAALVEGLAPVTEMAVEAAESCDLCGKCDYQCYFVTEMRPTRVMRALKDYVAAHAPAGGAFAPPAPDPVLDGLRAIVGAEWAPGDRAVAAAYSNDPGPLTVRKVPAYVVLPANKDDVARVVRFLNDRKIPWVVRGNGSQIAGLSLTEGAVLDLNRLRTIEFDDKNWAVKVGAGVSAFDLQTEARRRGRRVNVAEPAALVCSNVICSGIFSTFMPAYGTAADNFIDAEVVGPDGTPFALSDKSAPNLFAFQSTDRPSPGICTSVTMKLHPVTGDESGVLVPFESLDGALEFARDCAVRRIGLAIGILGGGYASAFLSPSKDMAAEARRALTDRMGMTYLVLVIGDKFAQQSVRSMGRPVIDQKLFRTLSLGLPSLCSGRWLDVLSDLSTRQPYSFLDVPGFAEVAEAALAPSPVQLARDADPDLRPFFERLYARPEMTDLVWLNEFRILSSRMGREGQFAVNIVYLPLEAALIEETISGFREIAERHGLRNGLGFITPLDEGKRALLEYDYFFDQTDPVEIGRAQKAVMEAGGMTMELAGRTGTVRWIRHVVNQGFSRLENLLYTS